MSYPSLTKCRYAVLALATVLIAGACSSRDQGASTGPDNAPVTEATTTTADAAPASRTSESTAEPTTSSTTEEPVQDESAPVDDGRELVELALPDLGDSGRSFVTPAMGGVRFTADESHYVFVGGDNMFVSPRGVGPDTNAIPGAYLGLISQTSDGTPLRTIEEFVAHFDAFDEVTLTPNQSAVELFGLRLIGFDVLSVADDRLTMFSVSRFPGPPRAVFSFDSSALFVAATPSGLVVAGYDVSGESGAVSVADEAANKDALATLLGSAVLTGPGFEVALPTPQNLSGTGSPPDPATVVDGGPPALIASFSPVEANTYQLPNVGLRLSIDIPDGWEVQPNFPGVVVLTAEGSRGPGDRGLVFVSGLRPALIPVAGGPVKVGEAIPIINVRDLLDSPPAGLVVENVQEVTVAGESAVRFDVRVSNDVSCAQDDACEFAFATRWGFSVLIQSTNLHRFWWFDEHPSGRAMAVASSTESEFIDAATELMDSVESLG